MIAIYEPRGRAREYAELAVNLYRGCDHGCLYCYAPGALHMKRDEFASVRQREGIIEAIEREAPKHAGREVLLCFTCDPYSPGSWGMTVTRPAILALQAGGCRVNVLTKGGLRSHECLELLRPGLDRYGATLTFARDDDSDLWEPGAAVPGDRIAMLKFAKDRGIETWASMEPVIDPEQSLALVQRTVGIVDLYKIGRWNHDARANAIDWRAFARAAIETCEAQGSRYVLKRDLAEELDP